MQDLNDNARLKAEVLNFPAYQDRCEDLLQLFKLSRQWSGNPESLLEFQSGIAQLHAEWQKKKREFKSEGNVIGETVTKRLIVILKRIVDAFVWRILSYDRVAIQLLSEHSQTGHIDSSIHMDFTIAQSIVKDSGALVIINDLTSTLLHGDLTIVEPDGRIIIRENKSGRSSRRDRRAKRQKQKMHDLAEFLNSGSRVSKDLMQHYILRADTEITTYHSRILEVIKLSKQSGYHRKILSDCFAIEACWINHPLARMPSDRPFDNVKYIIQENSLGIFDGVARRIAPYSIFPFDDEICFALLSGELMLRATLNFDALSRVYLKNGIILELPNPSDEEIEAYLALPHRERMRVAAHEQTSWFMLHSKDTSMQITPDLWGRVTLEFIDENSIVQADLDVLRKIAKLNIPTKQTARFYHGYVDESHVWK